MTNPQEAPRLGIHCTVPSADRCAMNTPPVYETGGATAGNLSANTIFNASRTP